MDVPSLAVFKKGGSTTPGNASQVSDGAGCVVVAKRSYAQAKGLKIMVVRKLCKKLLETAVRIVDGVQRLFPDPGRLRAQPASSVHSTI